MNCVDFPKAMVSMAQNPPFLVFAILSGALVFLVFLMKPSVAAKGAHIAAE